MEGHPWKSWFPGENIDLNLQPNPAEMATMSSPEQAAIRLGLSLSGRDGPVRHDWKLSGAERPLLPCSKCKGGLVLVLWAAGLLVRVSGRGWFQEKEACVGC